MRISIMKTGASDNPDKITGIRWTRLRIQIFLSGSPSQPYIGRRNAVCYVRVCINMNDSTIIIIGFEHTYMYIVYIYIVRFLVNIANITTNDTNKE